MNLEVGAVIDGRYRVVRPLGEGGMGIVMAARHLQLDQPVALKVLRREALDHPGVAQRFLREARAAVRLKSEHVCRVSDVSTLPTGEPYMVMEMLEGADLGAVLAKEGPLPIGRAVDYLLQACDALAEAHALGIVHRDIKPANLFLTHVRGAPFVKVLDFGIAKVADVVDGGLTSTQMVMGSPSYMSPEQLRGAKAVDARSDIWALGVTLYELVSGRRPFAGDTMSALSIAIATEPYAPLDDAPPPLAACIERCLQKRPDDRYRDIAELAAALAPLAQTEGRLAPHIAHVVRAPVAATLPPDAPDVPIAPSAHVAEPARAPDSAVPPRRSRAPIVASVLGLVVVAGVVVVATRDRGASREEARLQPPPSDATIDASTVTASGPIVPDFRSGARLKVESFASEQGLAMSHRIFDSKLGVPCVLARAEDGVERCLPYAFGENRVFADAACKRGLVVRPGACSPPKYIAVKTSNGLVIHDAGPKIPATRFYTSLDGRCAEGSGNDDEVAYAARAKLRADGFERLYTAANLRNEAITTRTISGDGMQFTYALFDELHKARCELDDDGVCRPPPVNPDAFADAKCTQPLFLRDRSIDAPTIASIYDAKTSRCELPRKLVYTRVPADDLREIYVRSGVQGCTKQPRGMTEYDRLGELVETASLPVVTKVLEGRAGERIARQWYANRDGHRLMVASLYDQERQAPCRAGLAADGEVRCLPKTTTSHRIVYTDRACTRPAVRMYFEQGCPLPDTSDAPIIDFDGLSCAGDLRPVRVYQRGAQLPAGQVCYKRGDRCDCQGAAGEGELFEATEVRPASFPKLVRRIE